MSFLSKIGKAIGSVASPLISGAFGIGSAILGNKSQKDTNQTSMQIAQMNNEWSERMMEKQHAYDVEMWNKNNAYNTPQAQRERYESAGLNPAMMMQGGNAGVAQGGSSVGMPSPTTPNIQPLRYEGFANAISNTIQQSMMIAKNTAEIDAIGQTQDRENALARARILELTEETRNKKFRNELNDITKNLQVSHMNEDFLKKIQERTNMEEQRKLMGQQIIAQNLINQNLPEKLAMEISIMATTRDINRKNIKLVSKQIINQVLENNKISYNREQIDRLKEAVVTNLEHALYQGYIGSVSSLFSGIGSLGGGMRKKVTNIDSRSTHSHVHGSTTNNIYNK